jgi:hypothetical protein
LKIPGGFFEDEPDPFDLVVFGQNWTGYFTVAGPPNDVVTNYIYGLSGNCVLKAADGPPDIIIDSTPRPKKSARSKYAKKKK